MTEKWYLVKYVEDLRRNEPINVGVVVTSPRGSAVRFIGQKEDGSIDGRRARKYVSGLETYREWVNFIGREAERGELESRIARMKRRAYNYLLEERGPLLGDLSAADLDDVVGRLFEELVGPSQQRPPSAHVLASRAISQLDIPPDAELEREVTYAIQLKDSTERQVRFDYRYRNGRETLLDAVGLSGQSKSLSQRVHDLIFRIEHVEKEWDVNDFVVMYSVGAEPSDESNRHLTLIEKYANTVNVETEDTAARTIGEILHVPLRPAHAAEEFRWQRGEIGMGSAVTEPTDD